VASPALKEGAAAANRPTPPLVTHVPVVVTEDRAGVYAGAQRQVSFYARVPYYSQMFQDAGFPEAKEGEFSERMTDAIVVHGSASEVKDRLRELPAYGAGELLAMPILPPGDERGSLERTLAVLGELAAE
jgi:alkanesulfonate monooxygenase SsuD/methylene tetrahydromethanopterin reductase-like flavin-dependent oxidoreductase (luciferase family)